jgi:ABC-type Fe3+/spermidine/putrescine transport system ATPase subunit
MSEAILKINGLVKSFGTFTAVDNLDLDVKEGEILALLGPSGCGKTTTLRMIAGLERPTGGRIEFDRVPFVSVNDGRFLPPNKRNVGMVFQSYALWPHMSAFKNVAYPLRIRGVGRAEIRERVRGVLDLFGLGQYAERQVHQLSGGQQQRVALARALVYEPKLVLFDEPFSNLDAQLRTQMRIELKSLQKRFRLTGVFVTHDQLEALSLADRVAIMRDGRVEQIGRPEEIYDKPATRFVRDFLGRIVTIQGRAVETARDGRLVVAVAGESGRTLVNLRANGHAILADHAVEVAIRPENIRAYAAGGARTAGTNAIEGRIEDLLFTGDSYESRIRLGGESVLFELPRDQKWQEGQTVILEFGDHNATVWPLGGEQGPSRS